MIGSGAAANNNDRSRINFTSTKFTFIMKRLLAVLLLIIGLISPPLITQADNGLYPPAFPAYQSNVQPLDIVLLIDSSGSVASTDPDDLRISAAAFLLDYILAAGETSGLNHRFAVANFNTDVLDVQPLTLLQENVIQNSLVARSDGFTDFVPPIQFASNELSTNSPDVNRNMVIVLFTDGRPELVDDDGEPQTINEEQYFADLGYTVDQLQSEGVQIFVVAVGDTLTDRQLWTNEGGVSATHYRSVDSTTDLADVYHGFMAELLGLQTVNTRELEDGDTFSIVLPAYLDQVIFSLVKDDPTTSVVLQEPSGAIVPSSQGGGSALHEIYVIPKPLDGQWFLTISGGGVQLWVDQRYPLLTLTGLEQSVALGSDVIIESQVIRLDQPVIDNSLVIEIIVDLPSGQIVRQEMEATGNGRYQIDISGLLLEPGEYALNATALIAGNILGVRTSAYTFRAFPVPEVVDVTVEGNFMVSQPVTVTAYIDNYDRMPSDVVLPANLRTAQGLLLGSFDLHDDGLSPDEIAADGIFSGNSFFPSIPGTYVLDIRLQGITKDEVPYAISSRTSIQINPFILPTISPSSSAVTAPLEPTVTLILSTPESTSVITLEGETNKVTTREQWLIGVLLLLGAFGGYQIYQAKPWNRFERRQNRQLDLTQQLIEQGKANEARQKLDEILQNVRKMSLEEVEKPQKLTRNFARRVFVKYAQLYPNDLQAYYQAINHQIIRHKNDKDIIWGIIDALNNCWNGDIHKGILYLYDSFFVEVNDLDCLYEFAQHPHNLLNDYVRHLIESIESPNLDTLQKMANKAQNLIPPNESLQSVYKLLAELYENLPFTVSTNSYQETYDILEKTRSPIILWELFENVHIRLKHLAKHPGTLDGWEIVIEQLEKTLVIINKYQQSPEAKLLQDKLQSWQQYAKQQTMAYQGHLMVTPGSLAMEIRPSLEVERHEEKFDARQEWQIAIPLTLYHLGDWPVKDIVVQLTLDNKRVIAHEIEFLHENKTYSFSINLGILDQPSMRGFLKAFYKTNNLSVGGIFKAREQFASLPHMPEGILLGSNPGQKSSHYPLANPYISDRPLTHAEFDMLFKGKDRELVDLIPRFIEESNFQSRLISLMGLRRTGKTTILKLALAPLRNNATTPISIVEVDLLSFLRDSQRDFPSVVERELDDLFWQHVYQKLQVEVKTIINSEMDEVKALHHDRNHYESIQRLLKNAREKLPELRFVLAFDEADYFGHEWFLTHLATLQTRLLDIVLSYDMALIIVHDNIRTSWQESLVKQYYEKTSAHSLAQYHPFRTHFITLRDAYDLLEAGPLTFTPLAKETVSAFTGGYASLVQLLCQRLVDAKNAQWKNKRNQPLLPVTVRDVKDIILEEINNHAMVQYVFHGFDANELRLLLILAQAKFVDETTGILAIPHNAMAPQLARLYMKVQERFSNMNHSQINHSLASLIDKEIISRVKVDDEWTSHLRWEIGWLYTYLRHATFEIVEGKLQNVLERFNLSF